MDFKATLVFASRFWPGLPKLWQRGDFHSLLVSLLFGWVLVFVWLATFVWPEWLASFFSPEWLSQLILYATWVIIGGAALLAAAQSTTFPTRAIVNSQVERQKNLEIAQEYYLQANYFEAERLVRKNNLGGARDMESTLLWISILRRTRRITQALELISSMELLDAAIPWTAELRSEKEQCLRIKIQTPPAHD
jgi:hypothetical protein